MVMVLVVMVATAAAFLVLVVMVLVVVVATAAAFLMVVVMMLMVMVAAAAAFLMVVVMMIVGMDQLCHILCQGSLAFHSGDKLLAGKLAPGGSYDGSLFVMLPKHSHSILQLVLGDGICTGEDDGRSRFHLVVVELTKVLHIDLYLAGIYHSNGIAQLHIMAGHLFHSADDITELAHAGGLNDHPVRSVSGDHLLQSLAKVAHQAAADAAGVHLGNVDARIL